MSAESELHYECVRFLDHEAELLDERAFTQWLSLLDESLTHEVRPLSQASHYSADTRATFALRVKRLGTGNAWADQPALLTRRLVSNVRPKPEVDGFVSVRSNLLVHCAQASQTQVLLCGERHDRVRRTEDGFRITARSVVLMGDVLQLPSLGIFL